MARSFALIFLGVVAIVTLTGCASDRAEDPNHVSTIPWNRPEKWEGQGALGGFAPQNN